ncbi:MAG: O-antigen ligase family protein [bacterium]
MSFLTRDIRKGIIDAGLILIILFSPLAFGSVHIWAYTLVELIVFCLLILWAARKVLSPHDMDDVGGTRELTPVYISFIIFFSFVLLQIIPVPPQVIRFFSPRAFDLYSMAIPGYEKDALWRGLSIYPHASTIALIKYAAYAGVFFLVTQDIRERKRINRLVMAMICAGSFEAIYGLYGYFSKNYSIFGFSRIHMPGPATGTYVNRNHFAGYLGMIVFVGIGYLLSTMPMKIRQDRGWRHRLVSLFNSAKTPERGLVLIMIITMILGIIFSLSRMGVFSFVVSLLLMIFLALVNRQRRMVSIIFIIFALGLSASLWYGLDPLIDRYHHTAESYINRAVVWESTRRLIEDYPVTGSGLGTYESIFQRYKPRDFSHHLLIYDHAHNDYLEILSEVGIIGILPLLFGGIYFLMLLFKKWIKSENGLSTQISLGGIGAMLYILLHSLTDFNMHIPANAMTLCIIMGLSYNNLLKDECRM